MVFVVEVVGVEVVVVDVFLLVSLLKLFFLLWISLYLILVKKCTS